MTNGTAKALEQLLAANRSVDEARFTNMDVLNAALAGQEVAENAARTALFAVRPRPIEEYHADMGSVLWWKFPIEEPPYVGTPLDTGFEVLIETTVRTLAQEYPEPLGHDNGRLRVYLGGWPGYHTHFTPIPIPQAPK